MELPSRIDPGAVDVLLCDADGCLFASEEPAFEASARVTNRLLAELAIDRTFSGEELRLATTGKNFRATATELAAEHGRAIEGDELERWVDEERRAVTAHLREVLEPDPAVTEPLARLSRTRRLAVVSSSALSRVAACLEAAGLAELFPPEMRFSAEDSLPAPASKPDPAIYEHAGARLGAPPGHALALEDSVPGARSAIAAGYETVGNVMFVPQRERAARVDELIETGAAGCVASWGELEQWLNRAYGDAVEAAERAEGAPA